MAQPKYVSISAGLPTHFHDDIRFLVEFAADASKAPLGETQIHVGYSEAHPRGSMSGYAAYRFDSKPFPVDAFRMRIESGMRYVVTLRMHRDFWLRYEGGSRTWHYQKYKTAPYTELDNWHQEFVYLAAHEMWHIAQYERSHANKWTVNGRPRGTSEIECELHAVEVTALYKLVERLTTPILTPLVPTAYIGRAARLAE